MSRGGNWSRSWITCPKCGRRVARFDWLFPDGFLDEVKAVTQEGGELPPLRLEIVEMAKGSRKSADQPGDLVCPRGHRVHVGTDPADGVLAPTAARWREYKPLD